MRTAFKFALVVGVLMLLIVPSSAWLSGYTYRQMHNITGYTTWTSNKSYYAVRFVVNNSTGISFNNTAFTNGHSQVDWDDIRFTDLSDTPYDYWIETGTTTATSATFWVEFPTISNMSDTLLYMYYGNPTTTTASDGTNTFRFFDDFDGAAIDATKWTIPAAGTSVSGGIMTFTGTGALRYLSTITTWGESTAIESYINTDHSGSGAFEEMITMTGPVNHQFIAYYSGTNPGYYYNYHGAFSAPVTILGWSASTWHRTTSERNPGANITWRVDYGTEVPMSSMYFTDATTFDYRTWQVGGRLRSDWVAIRNHTLPRPLNIWWGSEEGSMLFIQWDKTSYASGETASINTSFTDDFWDTINYTYYCNIYRYPDLTHEVSTYTINQQYYDKLVDTSSLSVGTYYAMLYLTDIGTGTDYFVDYDTANVVNGITISGMVFNATSGASLSGATVDVTQAGTTTSYTSTLAGYLTTTPLNIGQPITVDGSMAGYSPYTSTFTPPGAANITKSIPLVSTTTACYWTAAANSTSITGLVDEMPYYVPANGAYLNLSNATWYSNITLGLTGWYIFEDLNNTEPYSLVAGKAGFDDYSATVTSGTDDLTWYNFTLGADFDLTVYVEDATSGAPLTENVTIEIEDTVGTVTSTTTTSGNATFSGISGGYTVTAACLGYVSGSTYVNVDADKNVTLSLTQATASSTYYTPHDVQIIIQDNYGNPILDTSVTVTPTDTTLGDWSWMNWLMGVPTSVNLQDTPLYGTTDSRGGCTFVMVKEVKYKVDIVNVAEAINETHYLFPKDDLYVFIVDTDTDFNPPTSITGTTTWNLTNTTINATHGNLTLQYYDSSGTTTNLSFWVKSHTSPVTTCYQTYCSNPNNCDVGYVCGADNGQDYYWGFTAETTRGTITASEAITYQKLVNLGIMTAYYPWIAAAFLIVIAAVFSVISVKFGAVLIPVFAYLFFYMKWLTLTWAQTTLLTVLLVIGVFAYIRKQEDKVGN